MSDSLDPVDCSLPGSSVHGILQARRLEWVAISFSRLENGKKLLILSYSLLSGCFVVPLFLSPSPVVFFVTCFSLSKFCVDNVDVLSTQKSNVDFCCGLNKTS